MDLKQIEKFLSWCKQYAQYLIFVEPVYPDERNYHREEWINEDLQNIKRHYGDYKKIFEKYEFQLLGSGTFNKENEGGEGIQKCKHMIVKT